MYQFRPQAGLPPFPVQSALANAAEALRVAEFKLGQAIRTYATDESIGLWQLQEYRSSARLYVSLLAELVSDGPTIPSHVYRTLRLYRNETKTRVAHVEGAVLALLLAVQEVEAAMELTDEEDLRDMLAAVVFGSRTALEWLSCMISPVDFEQVLEEITDGPFERFAA